jgi:hypothetical protein
VPVEANPAAAADPTGKAADPTGAWSPVAGAYENRDHFGGFTGAAFDREIIDVAAAATAFVDQLMVEDMQPDVELSVPQFCPAFVMIINGTALNATTAMTTR